MDTFFKVSKKKSWFGYTVLIIFPMNAAAPETKKG